MSTVNANGHYISVRAFSEELECSQETLEKQGNDQDLAFLDGPMDHVP
jgi:hypothetical protein